MMLVTSPLGVNFTQAEEIDQSEDSASELTKSPNLAIKLGKGVIVSAISRKANLSHYAVLDKCEKLINAGLIESTKNDRNRIYSITEKGLEFFQEFQKFQSLIESMNLRY